MQQKIVRLAEVCARQWVQGKSTGKFLFVAQCLEDTGEIPTVSGDLLNFQACGKGVQRNRFVREQRKPVPARNGLLDDSANFPQEERVIGQLISC